MNSNWNIALVGIIVILLISVILLILKNRQIKKTTYLKKIYGELMIVSLDGGNHWYPAATVANGVVIIGVLDKETLFCIQMQKIIDLMSAYNKRHPWVKLRSMSKEEIDHLQQVKR